MFTEVQRESLSLMRNVTYVCTTLCFCALMYFPTSLFPFVPKYLETHFHVSTGLANVLTCKSFKWGEQKNLRWGNLGQTVWEGGGEGGWGRTNFVKVMQAYNWQHDNHGVFL